MTAVAVGFYGKLPSLGDFVQRGLPDGFVNRLDAWLQEGLARSRGDLGEAWLDTFLTSPLWRYAFSTGVVDDRCWAGILLPSVDRVGRYFPLVVAAELAPGASPFEIAVAGHAWYDAVEVIARRVLEDELVDIDRLDAELSRSDRELDAARAHQSALALDAVEDGDAPLWSFALGPDGDMARFCARFTDGLVARARAPLALWWSTGSALVAPCVLMTPGLPPAASFRSLLGDPAAAVAHADPFGDTVLTPSQWPAPATLLRSAAVSDIGRQRAENQDAYAEHPAAGVWVVADGMGGHAGGAGASRLVVERVRAIDGGGDFESVERSVLRALTAANDELRQRGRVEPDFDGGATVVALCLGGMHGVVLWAGDSRLYRLRNGELEQLTRDHSVAEEGGTPFEDPSMITRAVGGADEFQPSERRFDVAPGDRYLLCTDGLYKDLAPAEIGGRLAANDCAEAATALIALALERGGDDNATALVVAIGGPDGG